MRWKTAGGLLIGYMGLLFLFYDGNVKHPMPARRNSIYPLELGNPFLNNPRWLQGASLGAIAQLWAWEHQKDIQRRFAVVYRDTQDQLPLIVKKQSRNLLPEYLYYAGRPFSHRIPRNVQEWIRLRMGQERYVLQLSPIDIALMAVRLFQRYRVRVHALPGWVVPWKTLQEQDVRLLLVLWEKGALNAVDWYRAVNQNFPRQGSTLTGFKERIKRLKTMGMVRYRKKGNRSDYTPTFTRKTFLYYLQEHLRYLDIIGKPEEYRRLRKILHLVKSIERPSIR